MGEDTNIDRIEELGTEDCLALLSANLVGRVGFVAADRPQVLPVTYISDGDGAVVFRTVTGSLLASLASQPVVFEVDGVDLAERAGWSVCVHGFAREITGHDDPTARRLLDCGIVAWAPGRRDRWFAVIPQEITGRRIIASFTASTNGGWLSGVVS